MRIVILYHPHSEFSRITEEYVRDFKRSQNGEIELVSLETKEGADMARFYDVVRYPAVLAISQRDNSLAQFWQGDKLPLMTDVASYYYR